MSFSLTVSAFVRSTIPAIRACVSGARTRAVGFSSGVMTGNCSAVSASSGTTAAAFSCIRARLIGLSRSVVFYVTFILGVMVIGYNTVRPILLPQFEH